MAPHRPFRIVVALRKVLVRLRSAGVLVAAIAAVGSAAETEDSLRVEALDVGRRVIESVRHRISEPVVLQTVGDTLDALLGGFSQAMTEAGLTPRVSGDEGVGGTVVIVRRVVVPGGNALDVRVERRPERSVLYSRLWMAGAASAGEGSDGLVERLLVPAIVGVAAALIVYLFFTVRS